MRAKRSSNNSFEESTTTNVGSSSLDESNRMETGDEIGRAPSGSRCGGGNGNNKRSSNLIESAHHDPKQRAIYLALFGISILSAITGLILLVVWMYNYRAVTGIGITNAGQLSNLHPLMMYTFMVSVNMYSVLIYRTHYSLPKDRLKWTHAILSGGNIVMSLLGVFAMFKAHLMANIPNFYSLHSWIGALTNIFYISQFIMGFVAFMKPKLAQHKRAAVMPYHRLIGASVLVLAALSAITGIAELVIFQDKEGLYSSFSPITFIANFAGISVILMTGVSIYLLQAPKFLRPRLPEEEPLKR